MDEAKRSLKGSPHRDAFKHWHKTLYSRFYSFDADLLWVEKSPPGIVALLDKKRDFESITFAETIGYNTFLEKGIDVYIVRGEEPFDSLSVEQYVGGDWRPEPPNVELIPVAHELDKQAFCRLQRDIRLQWRKRHL